MGDFRSSSGIDWSFPLLEDHITNRGTEVIHEMGLACHCRNTDPLAPLDTLRVGCDTCLGTGYYYRNPRRIDGLLTSIKTDQNLILAGYIAPGDCIFSPHMYLHPQVEALDKITFTHPQPVNEGQVIVRGAAHRGENKILKTYLNENEDRLFYTGLKSMWCEDENGILYEEGSDFVIEGKVIRWLTNKMRLNTRYTLKYEALLEWIAFSSPFERRDRDRDLGPKVLLRKLHVAILNNFNPKVRADMAADNNITIPTSIAGVLA